MESETTLNFMKLSKKKKKKEKEMKNNQNIGLNVKDICLTFVVTRDPILQLNVTGWWVDSGSGNLPLSKCLRAHSLTLLSSVCGLSPCSPVQWKHSLAGGLD